MKKVKTAELRIDKLELDKLMRSLQVYFSIIQPLEKRMQVQTEWERLKKHLESLPTKTFPKMDLTELPVQENEIESTDNSFTEPDEVRTIKGEFHIDNIEEAEFEEEICVGMDVCVYTERKIKRPWVGIVVSVKKKNHLREDNTHMFGSR